ncbi:MAG TPA: HD domain-containing protein [Candidatus Blautia faecipullorum]|nr:HD domain-containing protein [Candidatus Blautia faecipullorum]
MGRLNNLCKKMIGFYRGDPARIQHFLKVHSLARLIGQEEGMDEKSLYILEAAAYVHDIGIRPALEKYGRENGALQEQEGPAEAEKMMRELGFEEKVIRRVSYLTGHHHTYSNIEGLDYQILVEADFLVNYFENHTEQENIKKSVEKIFRTETGKRIAEEMFFPQEFVMSETWAQDGLQELDDFIESQGIYIRQ